MRHSVVDHYLDKETVAQINRDWPTTWETVKPQKLATTKLNAAARKVADNVDIAWLEELTGIDGLIADPTLHGAGFHCIPPGGRLGMHVDFNAHTKGWRRRVNVLIYLNERWNKQWGGYLQLGLVDPVLIAPLGGRCVVFETNDESWHGHPDPLKRPANVQRRSLALYFYTQDFKERAHGTIYVS